MKSNRLYIFTICCLMLLLLIGCSPKTHETVTENDLRGYEKVLVFQDDSLSIYDCYKEQGEPHYLLYESNKDDFATVVVPRLNEDGSYYVG